MAATIARTGPAFRDGDEGDDDDDDEAGAGDGGVVTSSTLAGARRDGQAPSTTTALDVVVALEAAPVRERREQTPTSGGWATAAPGLSLPPRRW
jgi:hypothetical protein